MFSSYFFRLAQARNFEEKRKKFAGTVKFDAKYSAIEHTYLQPWLGENKFASILSFKNIFV